MYLPEVSILGSCNYSRNVSANQSLIETFRPTHINTNSTCPSGVPDPEWLGPLMTFVAVMNFTANIGALIVFWRILNGSQRVQMIHYILFYLSLIEALNMLCYSIKEVAYRFKLYPRPMDEFSSFTYLHLRQFGVLIMQICSTWLNISRNWWLTSIALTRAVSVVRMLTRPYENFSEGATRHIKRKINILFCLIMLISLCAGVIFNVIVSKNSEISVCFQDIENSDIVYRIDGIEIRFPINTINITHELIMTIAPLTTMIACNLTICVALQLIARSTAAVEGSHRLLIFKRVTRTVFVILTVYILTEVPFSIFALINKEYPKKPCLTAALHIGSKIADFLVAINASCNIVIYYFWEKEFQDYVKNCCYWSCCKKDAIDNDKEGCSPLRPEPVINMDNCEQDVAL